MLFTTSIVAAAMLISSVSAAAAPVEEWHTTLLKRQAPGTPAYACHSACGNAITLSRGANPCTNKEFLTDYAECLDCAGPNNQNIWQYYGSSVGKAGAACGLSTTPGSGSNPPSSPSTTAAPPAASSTTAPTSPPVAPVTTSTPTPEQPSTTPATKSTGATEVPPPAVSSSKVSHEHPSSSVAQTTGTTTYVTPANPTTIVAGTGSLNSTNTRSPSSTGTPFLSAGAMHHAAGLSLVVAVVFSAALVI